MGKPQYDHQHQRQRAQWDRLLIREGPIDCDVCDLPVYPDRLHHLNPDRRKFDLDHSTPVIEGGLHAPKRPRHACCNRRAGQALAMVRRVEPASQEW